jgi:hypothetical protein
LAQAFYRLDADYFFGDGGSERFARHRRQIGGSSVFCMIKSET